MSPVPHSSIRTRILYKMCLSAVRVFNKQHMDCEVQLTYSRQLLFFLGEGWPGQQVRLISGFWHAIRVR